MINSKKLLYIFGATLTLMVSLVSPVTASAVGSASVKEAQTIMTKFGIPAGPIDGLDGSQTRRGLCIFRYMSKLSVNRNSLEGTTLSTLRSFNTKYSSLGKIPAVSSSSNLEKLVVNETCQAMTYSTKSSDGKHYYKKVMAVSTGITGHGTPNGTYPLNGTQRGWSCSTLYPESCRKQTTGRFVYIGDYGNMYNFRSFIGNTYGIHGSTSVPTYPASHGCVRVTVTDSDWMYDNVGNGGNRPELQVTGSY